MSVVSNEVKDYFTKGIKEGLSDYIAKDLLDIDNKGNDEQRKKDIKLASDLSAGVSIDMVIGGAYSIVKGSKNVVKADESLKENNVNSDTIVNSNAELKSNENNLNNKNSDGVGKNGTQKLNNNDNTMIATSKGVIVSSNTLAKQESSNLVGDFTKLEGATVDEIISRVPKDWEMVPQKQGQGIRFIDEAGIERIRIHAPDPKAPIGTNSNSGWILRIQDKNKNYLDNFGNSGGYKANETHIPIHGNHILEK